MNGPQHYAEAERLLAESLPDVEPTPGPGMLFMQVAVDLTKVALAQVHATLALTAATATVVVSESDSVETAPEWREVTR